MPIPVDRFVALITAHQREMYRYIASLVPNSADADDLLQETAMTLWKEIDNFDPETNFAAWATTVAHYKVLTYRKNVGRDRHVFAPELLDRLAERRAALGGELDERREALDNCLKRLSPQQQELINQRYGGKQSMRDLANETGRSIHTIYKTLDRIRDGLMRCIDNSLGNNE